MSSKSFHKFLEHFKTPIPFTVLAVFALALPIAFIAFQQDQNRISNAQVAADVNVTVDRNTVEMVSDFQVGVTHMQYSLDSWGNSAAVLNGKNLLRNGVKYQNQHIIGFGADDINPSQGVYQWSSLDARVQIARDSGNEPVITLCCAPGWMKASGNTWNIAEAPTVANYQNYANLAAEVAKRYPDVKYFQVWNEMKGFWNNSLNRWNYEGYTDLYNKIWTSVKAVRPDAKLGGPYISIGGGTIQPSQYDTNPITAPEQAVVDYWWTHKIGADFMIVDGWVAHYLEESDWSQNTKIRNLGWNEAEFLNRTKWFAAVTKKLKTYGIPVWWAEDYFVYATNDDFETVGVASMLFHELKGGASGTLRWKPQATQSNMMNLFTDTRIAGGGQPLSGYYVYKDFHSYFGPGTQILQSTSSDPKILVLASPTKTMLINHYNVQKIVNVNGYNATVPAYKWVVIDTPAAITSVPTAIPTLQPTVTPVATVSPLPTATPTVIPTATPTLQPTATSVPTVAPTPVASNLLQNPSFESGLLPWGSTVRSPAKGSVTRTTSTKVTGSYAAQANITKASSTPWNYQVTQGNLPLQAGKTYTISFWAKASKSRSTDVVVQQHGGNWTGYFSKNQPLTTTWNKYTYSFVAPVTTTGFFTFNVATATGYVWFDDVSITSN